MFCNAHANTSVNLCKTIYVAFEVLHFKYSYKQMQNNSQTLQNRFLNLHSQKTNFINDFKNLKKLLAFKQMQSKADYIIKRTNLQLLIIELGWSYRSQLFQCFRKLLKIFSAIIKQKRTKNILNSTYKLVYNRLYPS